jgi:hypothetical protein
MRPHLLSRSVSVHFPSASGLRLQKRFLTSTRLIPPAFPLASLKFSIRNERFHQLLTKQDH